jgi:hypothetical protein
MKKDGKDCFPSQPRIARQTALSERAVRTHLKIAQCAGWLKIGTRKREGNKTWFVYNVYTPTIPEANRAAVYLKPGRRVPSYLRHAERGAGCMDGEQAAPTARCPEHADADVLPEPLAETTGTSCQNPRQDVPTNSSENLSMNIPETGPPQNGSTGYLREKLKVETKPELSEADIERRLEKLSAGCPDFGTSELAHVAHVPLDQVRKWRERKQA